MTVASAPNLARHVLHHLGVERLVHGDEDTAHQQRRDQVLGANFELLGQVLDADALGHRDLAGDGQRLLLKSALRQNAAAAQSPSSGLPWSSGYCWRPRPRGGLRAAADAALRPEAAAPPAPGATQAAGTLARSRDAPPGPPGRGPKPGRPPGAPLGAERVGCMGRRPAGKPGAPTERRDAAG